MTHNQTVFRLAKDCGFDECAIISTEYFPQLADEEHKIIVLIKSYQPYDEKYFTDEYVQVDAYHIASNVSYFKVKEMAEDIKGLGYVADYSPHIAYTHCAYRAGVGTIGVNGLLLSEKYGSYFHIQCILTNMSLELTVGKESKDICAGCALCVGACRGDALDGTGKVDADRCIRDYMPAKRYVPADIRRRIDRSFIGCTDCRAACPHNAKIQRVKPPDDLLEACRISILADKEHKLHREHFKRLQNYLGRNEVRQLKLLKSMAIIIGNIKDDKYLDVLMKMKIQSDNEHLTEYIDWAINEIETKA